MRVERGAWCLVGAGRGAAGSGDKKREGAIGRVVAMVQWRGGNGAALVNKARMAFEGRECKRGRCSQRGPWLAGPRHGARGTAGPLGEAAMNVDESDVVGDRRELRAPAVVGQ